MDVLRIMGRPDFPQATDDERITLIRIANKLGGGGAGKLGRLWNSFPEARFPDVANKMLETRRWTPQHPPPPAHSNAPPAISSRARSHDEHETSTTQKLTGPSRPTGRTGLYLLCTWRAGGKRAPRPIHPDLGE